MQSVCPKNRSNSDRLPHAGILSWASFGSFLFSFSPFWEPQCSAAVPWAEPAAPAARWAQQKMWLGDSSHLPRSKANRTNALSNGALWLRAEEMYPEGGSFPSKSWQSHSEMARNIVKQNIKLWWTAKPRRFKLRVNRDVLVYINTLHANSAQLGALFGWCFWRPVSGDEAMSKKRCYGFLLGWGWEPSLGIPRHGRVSSWPQVWLQSGPPGPSLTASSPLSRRCQETFECPSGLWPLPAFFLQTTFRAEPSTVGQSRARVRQPFINNYFLCARPTA
jgi:hypothetical protein